MISSCSTLIEFGGGGTLLPAREAAGAMASENSAAASAVVVFMIVHPYDEFSWLGGASRFLAVTSIGGLGACRHRSVRFWW
jgi:hypothetical protein